MTFSFLEVIYIFKSKVPVLFHMYYLVIWVPFFKIFHLITFNFYNNSKDNYFAEIFFCNYVFEVAYRYWVFCGL